MGKSLQPVVVAGLVLASAALQLHPEHETDSAWHLTLGRAVLAHGSRVVPEPSAFEAFGGPVHVPEWLWGVWTLAVFRVGSWTGLTIMVCLLAAAIAFLLTQLLRERRPDVGPAALMLVGGLLVAAVSERLRLRPQTATLLLTTAFLWATYRYLAARGRKRQTWGLMLCATQLFWAQLHGGFVLALPIFLVLAVPAWRGGDNHKNRRTDLAVAALLALGLMASSYGVEIFGYIARHASGESKLFIGDMAPSTWETLNPTKSPRGIIYLALWSLCAAGFARSRRLHVPELLLALLGAALVVVAVRFFSVASVLVSPLAIAALGDASEDLAPNRWWAGAAVALGGLALLLAGEQHERNFGPLGVLGLSPSGYPFVANAFIAGLPDGSNVLTSYDAGAPLGFWQQGRVRTYVDGRTPLHFDDTDFAIARQAFASTEGLSLVTRRYEVRAVVAPRSPTCPNALSGEAWKMVAIDPIFTTYVPASGPEEPLVTLTACGQDYLTDQACDEDGRRLDADIERLAVPGGSAFVDYLRSERIVRCGGDLDQATALVPTVHQAWYYRSQRNRLVASVLVKRGRVLQAVKVLKADIRAGSLRSLRVVWPHLLHDPAASPEARGLLEDAILALGDDAPRGLRAHLAHLCMEQRDVDCARHQGFRAAAMGSSRSIPVLRWLAEAHPSPRARRDALAWLRGLEETDSEAGPR